MKMPALTSRQQGFGYGNWASIRIAHIGLPLYTGLCGVDYACAMRDNTTQSISGGQAPAALKCAGFAKADAPRTAAFRQRRQGRVPTVRAIEPKLSIGASAAAQR